MQKTTPSKPRRWVPTWNLGNKVVIDMSVGETEAVYRVRKGDTIADEGITQDEAFTLAEDLIVIQAHLRK